MAVPLDITPLIQTLGTAQQRAPDFRSYAILGALTDSLQHAWAALVHLRTVLQSNISSILELLQITIDSAAGLTEIIRALTQWLENNSEWLVVFDDVEDTTALQSYLPRRISGHVIITTRIRALGTIAKVIAVDTLSPELGASFIIKRSRMDSASFSEEISNNLLLQAKELSIKLGGLPLALDQAASFIEELVLGIDEYAALYNAELRAERGEFSIYHPDSVTTTFSLAYEKVRELNPAAADIALICAFFHSDVVPIELFGGKAWHLVQIGKQSEPTEQQQQVLKLLEVSVQQAGAKEAWGEDLGKIIDDNLLFRRAIGDACRFSFMSYHPILQKFFSMHRLVSEVLQDKLDGEQKRLWSERAIRAVGRAVFNYNPDDFSKFERLLPHARKAISQMLEHSLEGGLEVAPTLLHNTARYLSNRERFSEAEPLFQKAIIVAEQWHKPDLIFISSIKNNLEHDRKLPFRIETIKQHSY